MQHYEASSHDSTYKHTYRRQGEGTLSFKSWACYIQRTRTDIKG